jgi:hypothetical protein
MQTRQRNYDLTPEQRKPYKRMEPKGVPGNFNPMQKSVALSGLILEIKSGLKMSRSITAYQAAKNILGFTVEQKPSKIQLYDDLKAIVEQNESIIAAEKTQNYQMN